MASEWLHDAREVPGKVRSYCHKFAVSAVVERGESLGIFAKALGFCMAVDF